MIAGWIGEEVLKHPMIGRAVGYKKGDDLTQLYVKWRPMLRECSPIFHVSSDDPPTMLAYPRIDKLPAENSGSAIHHALFGIKLKEKADTLKLDCEVRIEETVASSSMKPEDFLVQQLLSPRNNSN